MYEVRVMVGTLEEASDLLKALGERGYDKVSMGPPGQAAPHPTGELLDEAKSSLNKMNNWIVAALYKLKATEKKTAATSGKIVGVMRDLPEAGRGLRKSKETAKEQALTMFVGWARKNSGKDVSEARVREARAYLDELIGAEE